MDHSAHRRIRPHRALPRTRLRGLNRSGFNLRDDCSRRNRRNLMDHNSLGDRIQRRLPATELPANGQTLLVHSKGPKLDRAPKLDGSETAAASLQVVHLQLWPEQEHLQLENLILQRIQARIPGRVRKLTVHITDDSVELNGECRTYYTKQMAQHVAMGVLDYQQLVNNINVDC